MLEEKDDEKIRCCHHCMDKLLKRQEKLEEKDRVPDVVKLYEVGKGVVAFLILGSVTSAFQSLFLVSLPEAEDVHAESGRKSSRIHQNGRVS